jgi:hypothetical protein
LRAARDLRTKLLPFLNLLFTVSRYSVTASPHPHRTMRFVQQARVPAGRGVIRDVYLNPMAAGPQRPIAFDRLDAESRRSLVHHDVGDVLGSSDAHAHRPGSGPSARTMSGRTTSSRSALTMGDPIASSSSSSSSTSSPGRR